MPEGFNIKYSNGIIGALGTHEMYPAFTEEAAKASIPYVSKTHLLPENDFHPKSLGEVAFVTDKPLQ